MNAATYLPDLHAHVLNGICVSAERERERAREYGPGGLAFHFLFSSDNEIQVTFSYVHVDMNKERRSHSVVITNRRQPKRKKKRIFHVLNSSVGCRVHIWFLIPFTANKNQQKILGVPTTRTAPLILYTKISFRFGRINLSVSGVNWFDWTHRQWIANEILCARGKCERLWPTFDAISIQSVSQLCSCCGRSCRCAQVPSPVIHSTT